MKKIILALVILLTVICSVILLTKYVEVLPSSEVSNFESEINDNKLELDKYKSELENLLEEKEEVEEELNSMLGKSDSFQNEKLNLEKELEEYRFLVNDEKSKNDALNIEISSLEKRIETSNVDKIEYKLWESMIPYLNEQLSLKREELEEFHVIEFDRHIFIEYILDAININADMYSYYSTMSTSKHDGGDTIGDDYYPITKYDSFEELRDAINKTFTNEITEQIITDNIDLTGEDTSLWYKLFDGKVYARDGGMGSDQHQEHFNDRMLIRMITSNKETQTAFYKVYIPIVRFNEPEHDTDYTFTMDYKIQDVRFKFEDGSWKIDSDISHIGFY